MSNQNIWYLENIDVTGILCPQKMSAANGDHNSKVNKKGAHIYMQEDDADKIFFINEGRVKIGTYGEEGKEITKAILGPGEVFGELSLIGEERRRDFAVCMEDTSLCVVTTTEMKGLMKDHSNLTIFMMKIMGSRVLEMENRLESLVFKDSRTRIVDFLVNLAEKRGQRVGYETLVRKFMTHQEIANLTATSRQTVTTLLNDLRNRNLLTFDRRRLLIRDLEALKAEKTLTSQNSAI